ncbi:MAG: MoaD/ThiS family protein [Bacteroidales bacterium]|nr:MoaD/ThiS family protein [Bacteroidales bacterium]
MTVKFYAVLKEHFGNETEIECSSLNELLTLLKERKPDAVPILNSSRFAINNAFVEIGQAVAATDEIHVLPPTSGG